MLQIFFVYLSPAAHVFIALVVVYVEGQRFFLWFQSFNSWLQDMNDGHISYVDVLEHGSKAS